ncbi:MAG TPA: diguanylate cyclase [Candidatus Methanoperedens sp.]|nr:diguanylate cyclase [Candidatus Methanoperedens sp.]
MSSVAREPAQEKVFVLVVDDDADIRELLALTVRHEGWEPVTARTGAEAIAAVRTRSPTAALVDFQLPDMNGLEFIRLARGVDPELPCIAVTGQGNERVAVEIMKAGASDYLVKPFEPAEIVVAVRRGLEERRVRASRLYRDLASDLAQKNELLEQQMELLGRRMAETATLYEAARILTSQLALSDVMATVLRLAGELFQAAASSVRLLDAAGKNLELAAHTGLDPEYCRRGPIPLGASAAGHAALSGEPVHVADVGLDAVYHKGEMLTRMGLRSLLCLPLIVRGHCIGVVTLYHRQPREYQQEELRFLQTFAGTVSIAVDNARLYGEQSRLAVTDGLTGLYNHKRFQEGLAAEMSRARRYGHPLSLILLDIDHFKAYNDAWGHQAGDTLLRDLAVLFQAAARQNDLVARYGGEEFAFLLPQADKRQALALAKRLCRAVERRRCQGEEVLPNGRLTVSLGVASYPEDILQPQELVGAADQALYRAKHLGRNQVQAWVSPH